MFTTNFEELYDRILIDWEKKFDDASIKYLSCLSQLYGDVENVNWKSCQFREKKFLKIDPNNLEESLIHVNDQIKNIFAENIENLCQIAPFYKTRSQLLFKLGQFRHCVENCQVYLAVESRCDDSRTVLIWSLLARCHEQLGDVGKSKRVLLEALEKVNEKSHALLQRQLDKLTDEIENTKFKQRHFELFDKVTEFINPKHVKHLEPTECNRNTNFNTTEARNKKVDWNGHDEVTRGRYVTANERIETGEVLLIERALASFNSRSCVNSTCFHCVKDVNDVFAFPSPYVENITFCSSACFISAIFGYHFYEAPLLLMDKGDFEPSGNLFLALRLAIMHSSENNVLTSMTNHEFNVKYDLRQSFAIRSVMVVKLLDRNGYFKSHSDSSQREREHLLREIYLNQMVVRFNIHQIYRGSTDPSETYICQGVGSGLYDMASRFNHACDVNTSRFFFANQIIVVARRPIEKGEEITVGYGPHHWKEGLKKRQKVLLENYLFKCECSACLKDYPLIVDIIDNEGITKKCKKYLKSYQSHFCMENYASGCRSVEEMIEKLSTTIKQEYPNKNYEMGAIAMDSCWWRYLAKLLLQL